VLIVSDVASSRTGAYFEVPFVVSSESVQLRRSWVANSPAWCEAVREQRIESRRLVTDAAIVTAILEQEPRRVLDVGCGEGWLARALSSHGIAVTGIDGSAPLIEAAQALGGGTFLAVSYEEVVADPSSLGSGFDTIVANFSILDDRAEELVRALLPVLAQDGRLIVQSVHPLFAGDGAYADGWRTETFDTIPGEWTESMPWYFRTVGSWVRVFADAGYSLMEIREPLYPDRARPASILFVCRR
jgi:2-polyprenyl-3-methyl-5-hydroxy-6-metoxy-1,4-benzoquinol methylase